MSVDHVARGSSAPAAVDAPRDVRTDRGQTVVMERGYVVVQSVELIRCAATGVAPARLLAAPHVESLLSADSEPHAIGELSPPAGAYCSVRVRVGPADADADSLPGDVDVVGRSLWLDGRVLPSATTPETRFEVRATTSEAIDVGLLNEWGDATMLQLEEGHLEAAVVVEIDYAHLFDGGDVATSSAAGLTARSFSAALSNLAANVGR